MVQTQAFSLELVDEGIEMTGTPERRRLLKARAAGLFRTGVVAGAGQAGSVLWHHWLGRSTGRSVKDVRCG